jgi:hypothetical protein
LRRDAAQEPVVIPANEWRELREIVHSLAIAKQAPKENGEFEH